MNPKADTVFFCTECGYESKKWIGQCPGCKQWGTFSEEPSAPRTAGNRQRIAGTALKPLRLREIPNAGEERLEVGCREFGRVLGGGIVPGSVVLVGGEPGIGKSTLLLQTVLDQADRGRKVLYVSGEESLRQIRLRSERIGSTDGDLRFLSAIDIDEITDLLEREKPELCVIDSVQTMYSQEVNSAPGSVSQVRECARKMTVCAKTNNIAVFLVGHVTKEGTVAGPRVLEHIVDTVLYFESSDQGVYRILRSAKNRFGSTNEIGVFEMKNNGLSEVPNPSEYMLEGRPQNATGAAVTCLVEGTRPVLLEVQGLVTESMYSLARRQANGLDYNRLNMLIAVLEKRGGIPIGSFDAYVNIAGGMKITEPSGDLAVIAAIVSSYRNIVIPSDMVIFGEVGLSGEVRNVAQPAERIKEAGKLGFKKVILPELSMKSIPGCDREGMELIGIRYIGELFGLL